MKHLILACSLLSSVAAFSAEIGTGENLAGVEVTYTQGSLGYTDPMLTSEWSARGPSYSTSYGIQMKRDAAAVLAEAEVYFATSELGSRLARLTQEVKAENAEVSTDEAVEILVNAAHVILN